MTTKPPLQKILQGILHTEDESKQNQESLGSIKQQKNKQGIRVALIQLHTINPLTTKTTKWQESPHTYQYYH
jgi:hypothetical protein